MAIDLTSALPPVAPAASGLGAAGASSGSAAGSAFSALVSAVESSNADANAAASGMLHGTADISEAMIALQRADLTLQLTVQIRNKLVQAYQDIMRMPV